MDTEDSDRVPKVTFSEDLFLEWQTARRGTQNPEDMSNPVWGWIFRGRIDPYHANRHFTTGVDYPGVARWAGCRMGQSKTVLADGRVIWIAGEHEDFYDPDFYIYNDVIVERVDGEITILGYPPAVFSPTDFHSASLVDHGKSILIIGSIGYQDTRCPGHTPIFRLDTQGYNMESVEATGESPGWIHKHDAQLSQDETRLEIRGGQALGEYGFMENIDDWSLCLRTMTWTRLTQRNWPRFRVRRTDERRLHLFEYSNLVFERQFPETGTGAVQEIESEIGTQPNLPAFQSLFKPSMENRELESQADDDNDWRTTRICIDGIQVRFIDDSDYVSVVSEGQLATAKLESILEELAEKLSLVENCPCEVFKIS